MQLVHAEAYTSQEIEAAHLVNSLKFNVCVNPSRHSSSLSESIGLHGSHEGVQRMAERVLDAHGNSTQPLLHALRCAAICRLQQHQPICSLANRQGEHTPSMYQTAQGNLHASQGQNMQA